MAKTTSKKTVKKAPVKKVKTTATVKKKAVATKAVVTIEKISEQILDKLKALNTDPQLQSDINWCLGSYRHDHNPAGLYATSQKALVVFAKAREKNSRAVSAKLIADIEKILAKN